MYGTRAQLDSAGTFTPGAGHAITITLTPTGYTATSNDGTNPLTCTMTVTGGEAGAARATPACQ
jgi:hypothetical protein